MALSFVCLLADVVWYFRYCVSLSPVKDKEVPARESDAPYLSRPVWYTGDQRGYKNKHIVGVF
jgi:hypothetical protein